MFSEHSETSNIIKKKKVRQTKTFQKKSVNDVFVPNILRTPELWMNILTSQEKKRSKLAIKFSEHFLLAWFELNYIFGLFWAWQTWLPLTMDYFCSAIVWIDMRASLKYLLFCISLMLKNDGYKAVCAHECRKRELICDWFVPSISQ